MFQGLICPSSGVCDYIVELQHWLFRSWFAVCWSLGALSAGVVSGLYCTINFCVWHASIQSTPRGTAFLKKLAIILFVEPDVHFHVYKGHTFMVHDNQPQ